ncbi:MAG TPA: arginase family protein [bacterium]|nr:arginase family protein [bacterium]
MTPRRSRSGARRARTPAAAAPDGVASGLRVRSHTFFGAPPRGAAGEPTDVAFLGAPFDLGTTLRPGTRFGPDAVRLASAWWQYARDNGRAAPGSEHAKPAAEGWYDLDAGRWILRGVTMADWGDVRITPTHLTENLDRITAGVRAILEAGSLPVLVGGDHAVTYPSIRAFAGRGPLHIVQFDSHQDFNDERFGVRLGHGNPMRRASELPFVTGISQIGIRHVQKYTDTLAAGKRYGLRVVGASELRRRGPRAAAAAVPAGARCYLTLDIDGLDIAVAPGTGTPEPGGLTFVEMREAVRAIARRCRIVGVDLVEVSPPYDWAEITSRTAARLLLDTLAAVFDGGATSRTGAAGRRRRGRRSRGD